MLFEKHITQYQDYVEVNEIFGFSSKEKYIKYINKIAEEAIREVNNFTFGRMFFKIGKYSGEQAHNNDMTMKLKLAELKLQHLEELMPELFEPDQNELTDASIHLHKDIYTHGYIPSQWYPYLINNGVIDSNMARTKLIDKIKNIANKSINECKSDVCEVDIEKSIKYSHIPKDTKEIMMKYKTSNTKFKHGRLFDIDIPTEFTKKLKDDNLPSGFSIGIDNNGFFIYTHRARSKSYEDYMKIPQKAIKFIDSTG